MTTRRKTVKFTKKIKQSILDRLCEGYSVGDQCRLWPDELPHKDSIYKKTISDVEFGEEYSRAYSIYFYNLIDDCHRIANLPAHKVYPDVSDWREAEATLKRRIKSSEWLIDKVAPIFSKRFDRINKHEVAVEHSGAPTLAVINYYQDAPKLTIKDVESAVKVLKDGTEQS